MGKQPTKVDKIPQGYEFSHKDEVTGRDIYKKTTTAPGYKTKVTTTTTKPAVTGTPKVLRPPLPRKKLPEVQEDFVYIESTVPSTPTDTIPKNTKIPLYEDLRIDRKLQPPINANIDFYKYPDANAGYSKSTPMYFDKTTQRPVDVLKSIGPDGKYNPVYTDTLTANEGKYQGTVKQGNPRVTTDPTKTNILPGNEIDKSGTKKGEIVGTTGFKKGGLVQKLQRGGGVLGDVNEDGYVDAEEQNNLNNKQANKTAIKNAASSALGGVGSGYYNSKTPTSEGDSARSAGLAAASQAGPVGGIIGGVAAIGDKIGAKPKANAEQVDATTGELKNEGKAKSMAGLGIALSPSKRLTYAGGLTDVTGQGYIKSIEDKAKSQLNEVNVANKNAKMQQLIEARNSQDENPMLQNIYNTSGATFDANHNLVLANGQQFDKNRPMMNKGGVVGKVKQMCAKGGVIEGKGGPKDDKIEAKVKPGSFVVPAENTKVAETLREKLLMKAPKMKADLNQKGGRGVMLSNKEHLFTPEEKHELMEKGVDVNALAPDAEHKEESMEKKSHIMFPKLADGGDVVDPAKELAKIEAERKAVDAIKAKKESDRTAAEKASLQKFILEAKATNQSNKTKEWEKKYNDSKTKLDALNKSYEEASKEFKEGSTPTDAQKAKGVNAGAGTESQRKYKEDLLKKIQEAQSEHDNAKRTYDYVKSGKTYVAPKAETKAPAPKVETKTATTEVKPTTTAPVKTGLKAPKVSSKTDAGKFVAPVVVDNGEEVIVPGGNLSPNELAAKKATEDKAASDATALNNSLPQTVADQGLPKSKSNGILSKLGNIDPTAFVGIGQTAMGLNMLKDEKRPVDKAVIDPTYNANVNRSINDAKFGLSPEQKFAAEQDIQNSLNDARFAARSKGFSASDTLNQERASINDAWRNKLGLKTADTEMRMNKQMYADQQVANRANILAGNRRRSFEDAMSTFQQKQQAGSELIGAGLANTIGAYRFNKDLEAQKEANLASNAWTRQYGQTNV